MTKVEFKKRALALSKSIAHAGVKYRNAKNEYDKHKNDWDFDPKYGTALAKAEAHIHTLLIRIDRLWKNP